MQGDKLRTGDGVALLALSYKLENCCYAMVELNSNELNCTTNLRQNYDRLPEPLQRKWRKTAKSYRERNDGREPTLKELSSFIAEESQAENDPVYGKGNDTTTKLPPPRYQRRPIPTPRTRVTTMATQVQPTGTDKGSSETGQGIQIKEKESCQVCHNGIHELPRCPVFLTKSIS